VATKAHNVVANPRTKTIGYVPDSLIQVCLKLLGSEAKVRRPVVLKYTEGKEKHMSAFADNGG
jgi:hypothetical protein